MSLGPLNWFDWDDDDKFGKKDRRVLFEILRRVVSTEQQLTEVLKLLAETNLPPDVQAKIDAIFKAVGENKKKLIDALNMVKTP